MTEPMEPTPAPEDERKRVRVISGAGPPCRFCGAATHFGEDISHEHPPEGTMHVYHVQHGYICQDCGWPCIMEIGTIMYEDGEMPQQN